uniref:OBP47-like domain-containing protein n=1 Tax=Anopheles atroparvus TaxID=41427 RepID=A0AAG5DCI3_ANOAO
IPRFLPDEVIELCRRRPLPSVPPGIPEPIPENCIAECTLNVTRVLMNHRFRVEQARKVLLARTANDTAWKRTISNAIDKCYRIEVANSFYLQDLAQNIISTQCLPSSVRFLECTFAMTYRECPDEYWNDPNKSCFLLVKALNNCRFFFRGKVDALE